MSTRFDIVSVFPEFFEVLNLSLLGKAQERGIVEIHSHDLRDWTEDPHRTVDDTPAGGGAGMVMRPDIWGKAGGRTYSARAAALHPPDCSTRCQAHTGMLGLQR